MAAAVVVVVKTEPQRRGASTSRRWLYLLRDHLARRSGCWRSSSSTSTSRRQRRRCLSLYHPPLLLLTHHLPTTPLRHHHRLYFLKSRRQIPPAHRPHHGTQKPNKPLPILLRRHRTNAPTIPPDTLPPILPPLDRRVRREQVDDPKVVNPVTGLVLGVGRTEPAFVLVEEEVTSLGGFTGGELDGGGCRRGGRACETGGG